jgi:hypothetical protein
MTEEVTTTRPNEAIRALVDLRDRTLQKSRIAFGNRVAALERGADEADPATQKIMAKWHERFEELEKEADKDIAALVGDVAIVKELTALRGVGNLLAAKIVAMIDIERADTVSALWRYAGYGVVEGARERPTKGEKLHYNIRLKTTLYLVATSFLRAGSPYRAVYDSSKAGYEANRPDWNKAHIHAASMRRMIKVFLAHLWMRWRELEGLPVRALYVHEKLGHSSYEAPESYGWPTK